ncbi:N-acetyltransferase [Candidatus Desulforudis audaxviator]|uniref:GCN5-related N-acetyltransferase n=1 Tax=Desulforudis audaxviator (strain MP104C) TaxID=477974 RepID=B1I438_DESAP|nr:N-acetyltransferase [Candidatus Desulforudis audaxviator]ACA59653.1 GCN5-related N-acetyltransferase [Candidatus Desulforudis audaxviator MP104C]AZK59644.1 GCN5-related N-acetyltransferase [Candidatus Desulforudis audaxviator]
MQYRKARITDVEAIHGLISYYAARGLMLARPRALLYESIREFAVAEEDGRVVGAGGLHIIWEDLAEIRALAVEETMIGRGIGRGLVGMLLADAWELHIPRVFTLTYQPGFFEKCGFRRVPKEEMPQKVWKECINCPHFPNCNEESLIIDLK